MKGMLFVCMDVGVAAAYVVFVMEGYVVCVHGCRMYFDAGLNQFH